MSSQTTCSEMPAQAKASSRHEHLLLPPRAQNSTGITTKALKEKNGHPYSVTTLIEGKHHHAIHEATVSGLLPHCFQRMHKQSRDSESLFLAAPSFECTVLCCSFSHRLSVQCIGQCLPVWIAVS